MTHSLGHDSAKPPNPLPSPAPGESITLAKGYEIPRVIAGLWQLSPGHSHGEDATENDPKTWLQTMFQAGWTTFDCADIYDGVEELLGAMRRQLPPRERLRLKIHTKFVPDLGLLRKLKRHHVAATVERSLARTQCERLDLLQFHWWDFSIPGYVEAAGWLDELRKEGKIRHVGVTNFDHLRLRELLAAGLPIVSNQVQYSMLDRRPQRALQEVCLGHGVQMIAYGSMAGGLLSDKYLGTQPPQEPHENRSLSKYALIVEEAGGWDQLQQVLSVLRRLADGFKADSEGRQSPADQQVPNPSPSLAQIATRWVLDQPGVAAVILGTRHSKRLRQNQQIAQLQLSQLDRSTMDQALSQLPQVPGEVYALERAQGRHSALMKTDLGGHEHLHPAHSDSANEEKK